MATEVGQRDSASLTLVEARQQRPRPFAAVAAVDLSERGVGLATDQRHQFRIGEGCGIASITTLRRPRSE